MGNNQNNKIMKFREGKNYRPEKSTQDQDNGNESLGGNNEVAGLKSLVETNTFIIAYGMEINIMTLESCYRFNIYDKRMKTWTKGIYISSSDLANKIVKLKDYTVRITPNQLAKVLGLIRLEEEKEIPRLYLTGGYMGWHTNYSDTQLFLGSNIVGIKDTTLAFNSKHLTKAGNLNDWLQCCQKVIRGKLAAQTIVAGGFASVIIGMLEEDSISVNVFGQSSVGKSSLSDLVTTIYSRRKDPNIYGTFNSTDGYLESMGMRNNGVAVVIDDTSNNRENKFKNLVYILSSGISRGRLGNNGEKKDHEFWHTSFLTSSEVSFFESYDEVTGGMVRRLIELEVRQKDLTDDAEQAEYIAKMTEYNYGLAGIEFARYLNSMGKEKVGQIVDDERRYLQEAASKEGVNQGKAKKFSFLISAANLVSQSLGLVFDISGMREYLLSILESESAADQQLNSITLKQKLTVDEIYKKLCEFAQNSLSCVKKDGYYHIPMSVFDKLEYVRTWGSLTLRKELRNRGLIKVKPQKLYNKISAIKGNVVSILLNEEVV